MKFYWIEIHQANGDMVPFPSEASFEKAEDWYNGKSKKFLINYCHKHNISLDDPCDENSLINGWEDIAMATYAWQEADSLMLPIIGLITKEVAYQ
tara:strand:+ start:216 stop:500 length:285 start_codon:yes stop_codon:yes gene_type:complete